VFGLRIAHSIHPPVPTNPVLPQQDTLGLAPMRSMLLQCVNGEEFYANGPSAPFLEIARQERSIIYIPHRTHPLCGLNYATTACGIAYILARIYKPHICSSNKRALCFHLSPRAASGVGGKFHREKAGAIEFKVDVRAMDEF
jgi:hypothetical protein